MQLITLVLSALKRLEEESLSFTRSFFDFQDRQMSEKANINIMDYCRKRDDAQTTEARQRIKHIQGPFHQWPWLRSNRFVIKTSLFIIDWVSICSLTVHGPFLLRSSDQFGGIPSLLLTHPHTHLDPRNIRPTTKEAEVWLKGSVPIENQTAYTNNSSIRSVRVMRLRFSC